MTNVILLVLDALRSSNLPPYGYDLDTAPHISSLAKEGAVFLNSYALTDQTDPSFTTMMTGRHPLIHGIIRHGFDVTEDMILEFERRGVKSLPEMINPTSVALDWLGRWHKKGFDIYTTPSSLLEGRLFSRFKGLYGPALGLLMRTENWSSFRRVMLLLRSLGFCWDKLGFCPIEASLKLLDELRRPFFLMIHFWDTHTPFQGVPVFLREFFMRDTCKTPVEEVVQRGNELWRRQALNYHLKYIRCAEEIVPTYDASIRLADEAVGHLIDGLKDRGEFENTLIIVTGDHGDNLVREGAFIGHGGLFQRVLRVPLIIRGPVVERGVYEDIVTHLDLAPTILEVMGAKTDFRGEGVSLIEIFESPGLRREVLAVSSTARERYALITDEYKYVYSPTVQDAMDKYGGIWFRSVRELYDLRRDPDDKENLVDADPDIAREMERRLLALVKEMRKKGIMLRWRRVRRSLLSKINERKRPPSRSSST